MIDIRELNIGNSVLFNGKRVKVEGVVIQNGIVFFENDNAYADTLDPIPITEELLTELGFSDAHENTTTYIKKIGEHFIYLIKINGEETYDLSIIHNNGIRNVTIEVKYLHELEQFTFMTCKTELF